MSEGYVTETDIEVEEGVLKKGLQADLYTFDGDFRIEIEPNHDGKDFFRPQDVNNNQPSHLVKLLSRTGRFIKAGMGWTKNDGKGPKLSVKVDNPRMQFNVWQDKEGKKWRVTGGGFM